MQLLSKCCVGLTGYVDIICRCGHPHRVLVSNLVKGHHDLCAKCAAKFRARNNANSEDVMKSRVGLLGCQLEGKYEGWKEIHTIKYKCGHRVKRILSVFFRENRSVCPKCYKSTIGNTTRHTIEEIRKIFAARDCVLLTKEHQGAMGEYSYIAKCGHKRSITLSRFAAGDGDFCQYCSPAQSESQRLLYDLSVKISPNANFEEEVSFKYNGHSQRFDIFSASKKVAIEYDGYLHFFGKGKKPFGVSTVNVAKLDNNKNLYCRENRIALIRVDGRLWDKKSMRRKEFSLLLQKAISLGMKKKEIILIEEDLVEVENYRVPKGYQGSNQPHRKNKQED